MTEQKTNDRRLRIIQTAFCSIIFFSGIDNVISQTFPCDNANRLYFFRGTTSSMTLSYMTGYPNACVITDMFAVSGSPNALGANPVDSYLYYVDGTQVYRLDASGNKTAVCVLPFTTVSGAFDLWGRFWTVNSTAGQIMAFDLTTCSVVKGPYPFSTNGSMLDIVFNPYDCKIYAYGSRLDTNGVVDPNYTIPAFSAGFAGTAAMGNNGSIYVLVGSGLTGTGTLNAFDPNTGNTVSTSCTISGPGLPTGNSDGASFICPDIDAKFSADSLSGCAPLTVNFKDLSTGNVSGINWNFGDPGSGVNNQTTVTNPAHTFNAPGTYTVVLTAISNMYCAPMKDYDTVVINVKACGLTVTAFSGAICSGSCYNITAAASNGTSPYTYSWNPSAQTTSSINVCPSATTVYSVTITDAHNITATSTATVTINPPTTATISSPATICAGSSATLTAGGGGTYLWSNGSTTSSIIISPTASSNYSVVVVNGSGCKDSIGTTITVTPNINPTVTPAVICSGDSAVITASGGTNYSWNTGGTASSITVSPASTTSYTVLVTAASCTATAVATVTVSTAITANVSGNTSLCTGSSTTLTVTGGSSFSWSTGGTSVSIIITPTSNSTYSVWVSSGTCKDSTSVTVNINPLPTPTVSAATICAGNFATLTAGGGNSYSWNPGGNTSSVITVNPTSTTNYTVMVTSAAGCSNTASTSVTVNLKPSPSINANPTICIGDAATLTVSGGGTYSWNTGGTDAIISPSPSSTTSYSVIVTNANGCTAAATAIITVSLPPHAAITGNNLICFGSSTVLTAGGGGNYLWNTGQTSSSISITPSATASYSLLVSIGKCMDSATYIVKVLPTPIATVQSSVVINIGDNTTLMATGGGTYSWVPSTGLSCTNCSNPVASPEQTTDYCVYVRDAVGCADTACATVTVDYNCHRVYVPNAFSPNGDGENDILYVYGNCIVEMKLDIYNRWGQKVYEGTDPKQGWDGTFKGMMENTAVFDYYLTYKLITGAEGSRTGNISLIR